MEAKSVRIIRTHRDFYLQKIVEYLSSARIADDKVMPVTNAKWRIRNLVSTRHREWPMFQEPMLPIRLAPTTETIPTADNDAATVQNAPAEVNAGVAERIR